MLVGRRIECEALDRLLADVIAGQSRVAVLRGDAGVGKSALLEYLSDRVAGWHVARAVGVESEMELAYSSLHLLCAPMLDHVERLPIPQRDALATVFGRSAGPAPDKFLVGLATLTLFAEVAEQQPLVCVVDDAQWLDQVSAQIIGFVARRLLAERIAVVFAARTGIGDHVLAGLPVLAIEGLADSDARALLLGNVQGPLDAAVCEQIVRESHGNPLALLELPRAMTATEIAGGFGVVAAAAVSGRIEESFLRRLDALSAETRSVLLVAAADPVGDPVVLQRATEWLGIEASALMAGETDGLLSISAQVRFRHPLVRSAVYRAASPQERMAAHRALAEATDRDVDPDRRAWHLAEAAAGPDEDVAFELDRSAGRAQARGGLAAAAAFLHRAAVLTVEPARRGERALAAAEASLQAGAFDAALGLLATAEAATLDEFQGARVDLVRAHVAFASTLGSDAPPLLLKAARQLEPFNLGLARETYLAAWGATGMGGGLASRDVLVEISHAVQALPPSSGAPRPLDLLLEGLAALITDGHATATPILQRAAAVLTSIPIEDVLRWGWVAPMAPGVVWDFDGLHAIADGQVRLVRDAGALATLPFYLAQVGMACQWTGDFGSAEVVIAEEASVAEATRSPIAPYTLLRLRALQGREAEATAAISNAIEQAAVEGQLMAATWAQWAATVLYNGLGRYPEAASAARQATADTVFPVPSMWVLPELVESAARGGHPELAREALGRLAETTQPCGTDVALGIEARCRALLSDGAPAEDFYREAIDRLSRTPLRPDLARAHLLYGEWLRRERRRGDARDQLRTAYEMLSEIGMAAFAERARRELVATGEKARRRSEATLYDLTPQELQIARLARDGRTNPEIGAQLFLSARTVEWHLRNVFTKLNVSSRKELREAQHQLGQLTVPS